MDSINQLAILGSTGSIGRQTLEVVRALPHRFRVAALAAGHNLKLLAEQIREFKPGLVDCQDDQHQLPEGNYQFLDMAGMAAHPDIDTVVVAVPGSAGLMPLIAATKAGKTIALANKEALVSAGAVIMPLAQKSGSHIRPVDSEHSAIWQCLEGETTPPARIILTASGGPFRHYSRAELAEVTAEQALRHPSWNMGRKVTVDSATLMNKGLEIIEAHWLFGMPLERIEVVIQPQSIIHSMVEFADGAVKAQLSPPDMRLPIQYALTYPERLPNTRLPRLDFGKISQLDFEKPDYDKFPCLRLAREAGQKGGTYPTVLCAADEMVVGLFLEGQIKFNDIPLLIEDVLERHQSISQPALEDILAADRWAREELPRAIQKEKNRCQR